MCFTRLPFVVIHFNLLKLRKGKKGVGECVEGTLHPSHCIDHLEQVGHCFMTFGLAFVFLKARGTETTARTNMVPMMLNTATSAVLIRQRGKRPRSLQTSFAVQQFDT